MIGEWSRKISNQICENQNEKEIIQYGLNQLFWILLNFFAIAISGVLWHEFCFSILVFLEIYFLRPYAGGYHADTEIKFCRNREYCNASKKNQRDFVGLYVCYLFMLHLCNCSVFSCR